MILAKIIPFPARKSEPEAHYFEIMPKWGTQPLIHMKELLDDTDPEETELISKSYQE
jgi:hypothetical protein